MAGKRQPTDVVLANGRKHLSRAEEAERRAGEVKISPAKTAKPPKWLPETLKKDFRAIGKRLIASGLYTELDADTLGRYLVAQHQWLIATAEVEKALSQKDPETGQIRKKRDLAAADSWGKIQERYFKQARNCANDMGLTVTSRCRLVVPDTGKQATEDSNPMLELIRGGMDRYA
jgi:putative phage terminase, small subunit, P27 family|nr:MAG TPA: terminase small subunit [Caudoviricetes sp.]